MKKFNVNILLFVAAMLFIVAGFSKEYLLELKYAFVSFVVQNEDAAEDLPAMLKQVDEIATEHLRYHNELLDINSVKHSVTNEKIIQKGDMTIIKVDENSLVRENKQVSMEDIQLSVDVISKLQQYTQKNGGEFLYIAAPEKGINLSFPDNKSNYYQYNHTVFVSALENAHIPVLDLAKEMDLAGMLNSDAYFRTDHHWKPEVGFWANGKICETLQTKYGFTYDPAMTDLNNYSVKIYKDWFLGAYGKKVGLHFTSKGADDIALITPKFETNLTEMQPYKDQKRTGSFEETALYLENIQQKDYYNLNPYAAYSGGDFRLQILKNNLNPEGKKIVILRDSFACAVTPFLALNAGEVHCVDVRWMLPTEEINVYEYIAEIQPDYVLVLYNGSVTDVHDRLNLD